MSRGRKKGSKNKPKVAAEIQPIQPVQSILPNQPIVQPDNAAIEQPANVVEVKKRFYKKEFLASHPEWLLTTTIYGTPIAIVNVLKNSKWCDLVVIPHYETKTYQTTINSLSVMKPDFATEEIAKQYESVRFCDSPKVTLNVTPETMEEPIVATSENKVTSIQA